LQALRVALLIRNYIKDNRKSTSGTKKMYHMPNITSMFSNNNKSNNLASRRRYDDERVQQKTWRGANASAAGEYGCAHASTTHEDARNRLETIEKQIQSLARNMASVDEAKVENRLSLLSSQLGFMSTQIEALAEDAVYMQDAISKQALSEVCECSGELDVLRQRLSSVEEHVSRDSQPASFEMECLLNTHRQLQKLEYDQIQSNEFTKSTLLDLYEQIYYYIDDKTPETIDFIKSQIRAKLLMEGRTVL
jgi:hypothetical protein